MKDKVHVRVFVSRFLLGVDVPHYFVLAHPMISAYATDHSGVRLVANPVSRYFLLLSRIDSNNSSIECPLQKILPLSYKADLPLAYQVGGQTSKPPNHNLA